VHRRLLRTLILLLLVLGAAPAALAQTRANGSDSEQVQQWLTTLDAVSDPLLDDATAPERYQDLRAQVGDIATAARAVADRAQGTVGIMRQMAAALGPAPAEGDPPEPASVQRERSRLTDQMAALDGEAREADLVATRAEFLLRAAADQRLDRFARDLLRVDPSPLAPTTWAALDDELAFLSNRLVRPFAQHSDAAGIDVRPLLLQAGYAVLALVAGFLLRRWLLRRWDYGRQRAAPTGRRKVIAAAAQTVARGILPAAAAFALAVVASAWLGAAYDALAAQAAVRSVAAGAIVLIVLSALAHALLVPDHPEWRVAAICDACARPLDRRFRLVAAGVGFATAVLIFIGEMPAPAELRAVFVAGAVLVAGTALLFALPGRYWQMVAAPAAATDPKEDDPAAGARPTYAWPRLRGWVAIVVLVTILATLLGYQNLAIYAAALSGSVALTAAFLLAVRAILREAIGMFLTRPIGRWAQIRQALLGTGRAMWMVEVSLYLLVDLLVVFAAIVLLLPFAGLSSGEAIDLTGTLLRGIRIGDITIKPIDIIAAILAFVVGVVLTRMVQRRLDLRLLGRVQIDSGVRNSVRTAVGYVGVLIAIVVAVGLLGLDLSQLALIAGALSVGIGFGLQNIVSNFVSGLILLAERPVKVGDWVSVKGSEGIVRRISVRSTELRTGQGASVIIPNGDFIANAVVNWTHKDRIGRIDIPVTVPYDSDPDVVRALLAKVAREDRRVSLFPAPFVALTNLGVDALSFELRVFVADVDDFGPVGTDLRIAIWKAQRAAGIRAAAAAAAPAPAA
jgi:small-conductance mechanosensitive channel